MVTVPAESPLPWLPCLFCQHYHGYHAYFVSISIVTMQILSAFWWLWCQLCQHFHGYYPSFVSISMVKMQILSAFGRLWCQLCQRFHGYNASFVSISMVTNAGFGQHFCTQSSLVCTVIIATVTQSVFSGQVILGLSCCLWHFLPRPVLKVLGTVVVWRHLQQPLVLNLDRLEE